MSDKTVKELKLVKANPIESRPRRVVTVSRETALAIVRDHHKAEKWLKSWFGR